jgi:pimeloyl-ACP methyl ester carboxylesterase
MMKKTLTLVNCSDRGLPLDADEPAGLYYSIRFIWPSLEDNVMQEFPGREVLVYTPPGYSTYDFRTEYPVLYLLHGYGGDYNYYRGLYSLAAIMDDLINSGEIDPMIVVTPGASTGLGGGFYTNSPDTLAGYPGQSFGGLWADYIEEVVSTVDASYHTIDYWEYRGISGHSMGGYGALKLAMELPIFGSASSMSAPLSFYGGYPNNTEFLGLVSLFPPMFAENDFAPGDTAAFYSISPGVNKPLTNMIFAMGAAFTPHDPADPDTSVAHSFVNPLTGFEGRIDLPFNVDGQIDSTVWQLWLLNDVTTMFRGGGSDVFEVVDLYVDAGDQDNYYFDEQSRVFGIYAAEVIDYYEIYSGSSNNLPADHITYIADRLRNVIMFHDESFQPDFEQ